jgi:hypothetical protein
MLRRLTKLTKHLFVGAIGAALVCTACAKETIIDAGPPVCGRGEYSCNGDTLQRCRDDGSGFDGMQICDPGGCVQGKSDCQKPIDGTKPLGSSDWVACPQASAPDRENGDFPCKPVDVNTSVGGNAVRIRIDPYEVTAAEYLRFWKSLRPGVASSSLPPMCAFKQGIGHTPERPGWPTLTEQEARTPAHGIDWCDAWAYCHWAGKRLCGAVGGGPATYKFTANDFSEAEGKRTDNEWSIACNGGGTRQFPYGNDDDSTACNTKQINQDPRPYAPVGQYPKCKTPEGVYDLAGNAPELIDMCEGTTGRDDLCIIAGGGASSWGATADCGLFLAKRGTRNVQAIRCCAD